MVGAMKKWLKAWLGIDKIEAENLRLAQSELTIDKNWQLAHGRTVETTDDHEARIAFCESQLTAKASAAKIVPKAQKPNWKQFRAVVEKSTEPEEETA